MAKKNLLSEAQVRRFQSLANIPALNEMGSYNKKDDEEKEMEEGMYGKPKKDDEEMEDLLEIDFECRILFRRDDDWA